ncbi:MAG: hypothetical protein FJX20_22515 [Alphaproteobacteria bacterium]|nr:hypothetical protein [Alphaproteobacteria bacterium]
MAKAKGARKKAAAKAKPKAKAKGKAKAKKPAPAKKAVMAKPVADSGLAKRVAALEAAIASSKKGSNATGASVTKAIDTAVNEMRQHAEDADYLAMVQMRKLIDKARHKVTVAEERLRSEIGAVDAKGEMRMDEVNALRRRIEALEAKK